MYEKNAINRKKDELLTSGLQRQVRTTSLLRVMGLVLLLFTCHAVALAQSRPTELKWGELPQILEEQPLQLALPDGTVIRGVALAIREDALVMDVKKTSNKRIQQKGNAVIPRASVTLIQINRRVGFGARALGTTIGAISGVVLGGYLAARTAGITESAGPGIATFLGVASLGAAGGYFAGKEIGKQVIYIKVVP
jgi:hypothetical protein